jgi:hypothetical protein
MIALWALVVVSDNSLSRVAVEEPVLIVMSASFYRGRNAPDHHLQNRAVIEVHPVALKQFGLHVGNYANRLRVVNCESDTGPSRVYRCGGRISAPSADGDRTESRGNSDGYNSESFPRYQFLPFFLDKLDAYKRRYKLATAGAIHNIVDIESSKEPSC